MNDWDEERRKEKKTEKEEKVFTDEDESFFLFSLCFSSFTLDDRFSITVNDLIVVFVQKFSVSLTGHF